jgi:hypothetical protein
MRTKPAQIGTQLSFEALEERRMLAGAVGVFNRTGGSVSTGAGAGAWVQEEYMSNVKHLNETITVDTDNITAVAKDELGFAYGEQRGMAVVPIPIEGAIAVPQLFAWKFNKTRVTGYGNVYIEYGVGFSAEGNFQYVADPEFPGNLYFHGHLFLAVNHDPFESGDGEIINQHTLVHASAPNAFAQASWNPDTNEWDWFANLNGTVIQGHSPEGVNRHFDYTIPFANLNYADFTAYSNSRISVSSSEGLSQSLTRAYATWGYVTVGPSDLTPGDFNYDGEVNEEDYSIWAKGEPQVDANLDGMIDVLDYEIWAANVDGILVSTEEDVNDGNHSYGDLSLREAIALASDANHPGRDIIAFVPSLVDNILLTNAELTIASGNDVDHLGPGADHLSIDAQGNSRVFNINSGANVLLQGMTITGGHGSIGGGIFTEGNLDLIDGVVTNNTSVQYGGGVYVYGPAGSLSMINSTIADNEAQNQGGGVYVFGGAIDITNSSISNNKTLSATSGLGGGLLLNNATALSIDSSTIDGNEASYGAGIYYMRTGGTAAGTIRNSTISNNVATGYGGGLHLIFSGNVDFRILNTTVSSNDASVRGGGVYFDSGGTGIGLQIINATIAYNEVASAAAGGGIYVAANRSKINVHNTIIAENLALGSSHNIAGLVSTTSSYNLVGPAGVGGLSSGLNNLFVPSGQSAGLAPLADNGGPTKTHALLLTSLAVDAGDDSKATAVGLLDDQRGQSFDRVADREEPTESGFDIDIGAFELAVSELYG